MKTRFLISEVNGVTTLKVSETGPAPPPLVYMNALARRLFSKIKLVVYRKMLRLVAALFWYPFNQFQIVYLDCLWSIDVYSNLIEANLLLYELSNMRKICNPGE